MKNPISNIRVGSGFDVHAFADDSSSINEHIIMLCGVAVPHKRNVKAHSDGDVAIHAVVDAILGAICQGDIGDHFPPSDDKWRDVSSEIFLKQAVKMVLEAGGSINNIDITIICETPKISAYKTAMKENITRITGCEHVNIKATTTEKLGFLGRGEGIAAQAIAMVVF